MDQIAWTLSLILLVHFCSLQIHSSDSYPTQTMKCTDTTRLCTSFLAFKPQENQTLNVIQSMFDVLPQDVTLEGNNQNYWFIKKNCSCLPSKEYATNTTYTVKSNGGYVYDIVMNAYGGLAFMSNSSRIAQAGAVVSLRLFCGCSSGLWNYLMSYVMREGDTLVSLASRFGVSMDSIEAMNGIQTPDNVTAGSLYYIPLNSVPGEPYPEEIGAPLASVPMPSVDSIGAPLASVPMPSVDSKPEFLVKREAHIPTGWIIGGVGMGLAIIVLCIGLGIFICLKYSKARGISARDHDEEISHRFQTRHKTSFCCGSGSCLRCKSGDWEPRYWESSNYQITIPQVLGTNVLDIEKPMVFTYEEVAFATDGFSDLSLLGNGTHGSVYYGNLHGQEVAIKRMTATKTREFMAEMKILCKVHHTNLVELIGYAASDDELFLIYEYAQKGSLRSHLDDPQNKGHTSLSWIMRVQIALDTARGLEYIHEHTKTHYVHRDIKTTNILLDCSFSAKISDFGFAILVAKAADQDASTPKVVGTYGYLAPEYLREGLATAKSDVYAFGVVLFEIISGKEAIIKTDVRVVNNPQTRSLASIMLAALRNSPDCMRMTSLKHYIDPCLMDLYPPDCLFKMAMLAKQCVDEDPILRPDMKQIVITLSQILLSSIEWEATLGGDSQVFSSLVQGR